MMTKHYSHEELIEHATLTDRDIEKIKQCRRSHNRLGFAYQIGFVRLKNRFPGTHPLEITSELVAFAGVQLQIEPDEIHQYASRQQTISQHQIRIRRYLDLKELGRADVESVKQYVFEQSCRLEQTGALYSLVEQYLRDRHILQPADSTLHRMIGAQRRLARQHIYERITDSLPKDARQKLESLLEVDERNVSLLQQLKVVPRKPSPTALLQLTDKLEGVACTGVLGVDLSWLNNNYQRALTNHVQRCSADRLRELTLPHRYAAITCFLWQTYRDTIDHIVDMYDKLLNKVYNWAQEDLNTSMRHQHRSILRALSMFTGIGEVLLEGLFDDTISATSLRDALLRTVSREELAGHMEQSKEWTTGRGSHLFHGVIGRFTYLRQFSKALLDHLELESPQGNASPLLQAVEVLKEMNRTGKRKLPPDAPIDFVPARVRPFVYIGGEIHKPAWECALLSVLRDEIKSGNLSVMYSKRFGNFDDFFIPTAQWEAMRASFFEAAGLPCTPEDVRSYLTGRLNGAYDSFLASQPRNTYAKVDAEGWRLSADPTEKLDPLGEEKLDQLKSWLKGHMRSIRLPELLIEVDNELHFTQHFMPTASRETRRVSDVCAVLTTILAHGCNVGPYTMSRLVQGVSYRQIQRITDWQLTEDNQRSALASVVNAITGLDTSQVWGEGRTSASDGQRFIFRQQVLHQTYSPKFSDFALEFYSFVADNYAPFYSTPIECTDRDAAYVLDGLLYNESDLELEEHYTDTHGYTENNFAAFAMLGKRFCPRIRGLQHQRIYRIDAHKDYGVLKPLIDRRDRIIKMDWIVDQWDRLGQFYATLQSGHTTANVALRRLNAMSARNLFYRANRELGRVLKTEFILQYMAQPLLRRRIRRGLLKAEQLHALARDVAYGKRGRMTERDFHGMMRTCSCLVLILACMVYWQAREIGRAIVEGNPEEEGIDISLLEHVSPIGWDNVLLYGEYVIDPKLIR